MKLILYLIGLILPLALWGQDSTFTYPKNQLKFNIVKVIDPVNPGIEIGYERKINKYISVHVAGAKLTRLITDLIMKPYDRYDGYRLTYELKYIQKIQFEGINIIPSISFVQNKIELTTERGFIRDTGLSLPDWASESYLDTFSMQKKSWAINANGSLLVPFHSFAFEFVFGMGIKNRSVTHFDRLFPSDPFVPNRHNPEANADLRAGTYYTVSMVMALRVAYCF